MSKLLLGQIVMTAGVAAKSSEDKAFKHFVQKSLGRYYECEWGDTCEEDCKENDFAVENDDRILAVYGYRSDDGEETVIWIITEWDRSATTIMFPHEY